MPYVAYYKTELRLANALTERNTRMQQMQMKKLHKQNQEITQFQFPEM